MEKSGGRRNGKGAFGKFGCWSLFGEWVLGFLVKEGVCGFGRVAKVKAFRQSLLRDGAGVWLLGGWGVWKKKGERKSL